ncbi:MAG: putative ABC transport system permease protein, partial [Rhodothermales bacterium]
MITNYAKTTLRGMRRHWVYSAINVMGLAVGFLAGFFILLWVGDEMSFNSDYQDADQVYRVMRTYGDDQNFTVSSLTTKLDGVLDEDYPEIEYAALMSRLGDMALRHDEMV